MILQVAVSCDLIEQWFTTGYELHGFLRVKEGIPAGAKLRSMRLDLLSERIWLLFQTEGVDTALCDQNIIVESNRELAGLEQELAFQNACISIESASHKRDDGWHELGPNDVDYLVDEVRYLELRGDLERHPSDPRLVKLLCQEEEVPQVTP
jgi:hypothetical protein